MTVDVPGVLWEDADGVLWTEKSWSSKTLARLLADQGVEIRDLHGDES